MSDKPVSIVAAREQQSAASKQDIRARMQNKKRREVTRELLLDGEPTKLQFRSISSKELDKMRGEHPPTRDQKASGLGVNPDTWAPALVAATLIDPKFSYEEMLEIWQSDGWSAGELDNLFSIANALVTAGFDIPPTASD